MSSFNWPPLYEPYPDPDPPPPPPPRPRRIWRRRIIVAAIFCALIGAAAVVFLDIGKWLVVEDPLERAQTIVVLSGGLPGRALEAARLYRLNYAPEVWVTRPAGPQEALAKLNIYFVGEEFYNQKVLLAEAVPGDAIRVLDGEPANTEEEVDEIAEELRSEEADRVIIVTSKEHTRRVRAIWNRKVGTSLKAIIRYSDDDPYDGTHWWRHTDEALDIVREVLGLLNAWAGFPLKHG